MNGSARRSDHDGHSAATKLFWRWRFFIAGFLGGCVGSLLAGWRGSATAVVTIILGLLASEWRRP